MPSKRYNGGNEISSKHNQEVQEKKEFSLKNFFGDVKKQKITEKITTADGTKVKNTVETNIHFAASANIEAKESENFKTYDCLNCEMFFARFFLALCKKAK